MGKRGRPFLSSDQLFQRGAKPGRVARRRAEELAKIVPAVPVVPPPFKPRSQFLDNFMQRYRWELDSFASRIVPNETLMLELGNRTFNWREDHVLTKCRAHAESIVNSETKRGPIALGHCTKFLETLAHGHENGIHADPMAFQNVLTTLETFGDPGWHLNIWDLFFVANFMGWKRETNELAADDADLLTLDEFSIVAIDRSTEFLQTAV